MGATGWGLLALATTLGLGLASPALAIVGSSTDAPELVPHTVMVLEHHGAEAGFCTGVVLAPTAVMTAAHCVPEGADLRVHYPEPQAAAPVLLPVAAVLRHPGYRADAIRTRERSVDLALLRLPAPLPDRFTPARLGTGAGATVGDAFTVAGYGLTREGEPASSGRLRAATLAARTPLSSVLLWATDLTGRGAGACTGDSGGPVLGPDGSVVAVTVWASGRSRRQCGDLTQALWIAPLRGWIDDALARWSAQR